MACVRMATCSTTPARTVPDSGRSTVRNPRSRSSLISLPAFSPTGFSAPASTAVNAPNTRLNRRPRLSPGFFVSNLMARSAFRRTESASATSLASATTPSTHSLRVASPDSSRAAASASTSRRQAEGATRHDFAAYSRSSTSGSSCRFDNGRAAAASQHRLDGAPDRRRRCGGTLQRGQSEQTVPVFGAIPNGTGKPFETTAERLVGHHSVESPGLDEIDEDRTPR